MEEFISPKEVSKMLKVSKPWPYIMAKRGLLPYYKIGSLIRFKKIDLEEYLEKSRVEAREEKPNRHQGFVAGVSKELMEKSII
jgi:excisionase family DNA binding protein